MRSFFEVTCFVIFAILALAPALYGLHLYALMLLTRRRLAQTRAAQSATLSAYAEHVVEHGWPRVTTQIPLYNELPVARRVIEAVAALDYPQDRHEIQVLDDSTDGTCAVVDLVAAELGARGYDVKVIRRPTREHYKAGALAYGLTYASGEFVAIFDADFVPRPDFLRNMIPLIASDAGVCCAQARWGHLNERENWATEALALGIDGHFGVEQGARGWNGFLMNFNGTAGIWRRAAIEDERVGGWSGDTITEDLDLSYRAQLAGWRIVYRMDVMCPAEVPADADAIKAQQRRWATGSMQCARKLLPLVWKSDLRFVQKIVATAHLTQYSISVFMVLMALFGRFTLSFVPFHWQVAWTQWTWWLLILAAIAPSVAYVFARHTVGGGVAGPVRIAKLIMLGLGLSVNNTFAVFVGLLQKGGEFVRTPKSGSVGTAPRKSSYVSVRSRLWAAELLLGGFCFAQWALFLPLDHYVGGIFFLLYAIGLIRLGWASRPQVAVEKPLPRPLTRPPELAKSELPATN